MKPKWEDAPDWARWLAQDKDGLWFWYDDIPMLDEEWGEWNMGGCFTQFAVRAGHSRPKKWRQSLEARP